MCNLIRIDLGANWKEEILKYSKKIVKYQSNSKTESFIIKFEYPDIKTVVKVNENLISQNMTREIVDSGKDRKPVSSTLFSFINNEWHTLEESQYSYNPEENITSCCRTRFPKNVNKIIEKSETQILKTEKKLKKIITNKETNHQSIEEFTYDDHGREIEFVMYDILNSEQMIVLKTTNSFNENAEIYSVFSTKSKDSNEWSIISKTIIESLPDEITQITEYLENDTLSSKVKQIKYLNNSNQLREILIYELIKNKWKLITKIEYEYSNKYLKSENILNFEDNNFVPVEKTEYENLDGYITKRICFEKDDRNWVKTSEQLYEYI